MPATRRRQRDEARDRSVCYYLPPLRDPKIRDDADGRLPVLLHVHRLRDEVAAEGWRLLRVLLVWFGPLPTDATRAHRQRRTRLMLFK